MYSIGQFSRITMLPVRTLRFYDQEDLLRPAQVSPHTGYRYYTAEQIPVANTIRVLKEMEFSLEAIRDVVTGKIDLFNFLEANRHLVEQKAQRYHSALLRIDQILSQIKGGLPMRKYVVDIKKVQEMKVVSSRQEAPISTVSDVIERLCERVFGGGLTAAGPLFSIYYDEDFDPDRADFEVCIPVRESTPEAKTLPASRVLFTTHVGAYDEVGAAYQKVMDEVNARGLQVIGPPREVYLRGPETSPEPEQWITEIQFPVI